MMHGIAVEDPASAAGRCGNGLRQAESQGAVIRGGEFAGDRHQRLTEPIAGRERRMLATASRASTGVPS